MNDDGKVREKTRIAIEKAVEKVQRNLKELLYYKDTVDGDFGTNTIKAVIAFQKDYGLEDDGVAGKDTRKAIKEALAKQRSVINIKNVDLLDNVGVIERDDIKELVKLQRAMTALGYMSVVKIGDYDTVRDAVKKFQKDYNLLERDGLVGPQTKFAINTVLTAGKKGINVNFNPKQANDPDIFSVSTSFLLGVGDALVETVKGIKNLFLHPIKTAEGIAFLNNALKPGTEENVLLSYMVGTAVKQAWDDFKEGDADKKARMIGRLVGEVALAVVGTKGVDKAVKSLRVSAESGKLGEMLGKVGKGATKADEVVGGLGKIDEALNVTTTSLDKLKEAFKGSSNPGAVVDEVVSKLGTTIKNNSLRVAYEKEVVGLKDMVTSLRKKGYNDEYIARTVNQARRI